MRADAVRWLRAASAGARQYDLVFLDPPYRRAEALGAELSALAAGGAGGRMRWWWPSPTAARRSS